jgi:hypothetical protein
MNKVNYIFPHLGLGDYLIVNGLIRSIIKPDQEYILFTNKNYEESIRFMFRDIKNLSYKVIPQLFYNQYTIMPYINHSYGNYNLIKIGYENLDPTIPFEQSFYKQFNVPFENKWRKFCIERDKEREKSIYKFYGELQSNYAFLHEDPKRNQIIDRKYIDKKLDILEVNPIATKNIFDYCRLIEEAEEVHCIESVFMFLADLIFTEGKLFDHRYTKGTQDNTLPMLKKNWKIL